MDVSLSYCRCRRPNSSRIKDPETHQDIQQISQSLYWDHWPPLHKSSAGQQTTELKEGEDSQNLSEYQSTVSEVPKVGVAAYSTPAEKFHVPAQVNDDVVHANVHLDLSDWLDEPDQYHIEDKWNQMNDCQDHTAAYDAERSSPVIQNLPDYIPLKTDLHKYPAIIIKEQLKNVYPESFDGIGKFKDYKYHISIE